MGNRTRRDNGKEGHWRRQIAGQATGDWTIRRYCREHGLSEASFHWWKRELARRRGRSPALARARPRPGATKPGHRAVPFTEIRLRPQPAAVPVSGPAVAHSAVEIMLTGGWRVRVVAGFDAPTLRRVLAVLTEEPSC